MANPQIPVSGYIGATGPFPTLGETTITLVDADYVLEAPEETCYQIIAVEGVQTAARAVIAPLVRGLTYLVLNHTTGGFNVDFGGPLGVRVSIPPDGVSWVTSDGAGYLAANINAPLYVVDLYTLVPSAERQVIFVDGFDTTGDSGEGWFFWDATYVGPSTPINIIPVGYTVGAWVRANVENGLFATWFGAKGDGVTDDTAAIQLALDTALPTQRVILNPTAYVGTLVTEMSIYRTSQPLFISDFSNGIYPGDPSSQASTLTGIPGARPAAGIVNLAGVMPMILAGIYSPGPLYEQDAAGSGLWMIQYGSNAPAGQRTPNYFFNNSPANDLTGFTDFTIEFFFNPLNNTTYCNEHFPGEIAVFFVTCQGDTGRDNHQTFALGWANVYGANELVFYLTTVDGTYEVSTGNSDGLLGTGVKGFLNHVAITYDGENLRMFVNGLQPDASMTIQATGALNQQWYEAIAINGNGADLWPQTQAGAPNFPDQVQFGRFKLSNNCKYTAPFTPPTWEEVVYDGNTKIFLDFDPSTRTARPSAPSWATYQSLDFGEGFPIWINSCTQGVNYVYNIEVSYLGFAGYGCAMQSNSTVSSEYGKWCIIQGNFQGIWMDNFGYTSGVGEHCTFMDMSANSNGLHNFHSFDVYFGGGQQFSYVHDACNSGFGQTNWHVVAINADVTIGTGFPNSMVQGTYAFTNSCSTILMQGSAILDDESGGFAYGGCLVSCAFGAPVLQWDGSYIGMNFSTVPIFLVQADCTIDVNTVIFGNFGSENTPLFSFHNATANTSPVRFGGRNANGNSVVDPENPGPVIVVQQEGFGIHPVDVSAMTLTAAGYVLNINDFFWSDINITDTTLILSEPGVIVLPFNQFAYTRMFTDSTSQPLTFIGETGTGIQIAPLKSASLRCDGVENWARMTPDAS
jgi:hypothetical protein